MTDGLAFPIAPPVNCWEPAHARDLTPLELLAYRSNLLGADRSVANWGGGNTSSKSTELDFRNGRHACCGSKAPVRTWRPSDRSSSPVCAWTTCCRCWSASPCPTRSSSRYYEHAVLEPGQPRASIETPLHSMLPFEHVDHTHPDAIIALCAVPEGRDLAERLWGGRAIWVDYERPGFSLGKKIALAVRERPDAACVLMAKHGLVTWGETAEECYARTIATIACAAEALAERADRRRVFASARVDVAQVDRAVTCGRPTRLARCGVGSGEPMVLHVDTSDAARAFADRAGPGRSRRRWPSLSGPPGPHQAMAAGALAVGRRATSTVWRRRFATGVAEFEQRYAAYVSSHDPGVAMRDPAPRVVIVPGVGIITTGPDALQASVSRCALHARHRRAVHDRRSGWVRAADTRGDLRRRVLADGALQTRPPAAAARAGRPGGTGHRRRLGHRPRRRHAPCRSGGARGHRRPQRRRCARGRGRAWWSATVLVGRWRSKWT